MGKQAEIWGSSLTNKSARGPPPGLNYSGKGNLGATNPASTSATSNTNGWIGGSLSNRSANTNNWSSGMSILLSNFGYNAQPIQLFLKLIK